MNDKPYYLRKLSNDLAIVFAISEVSPLDRLKELEQESDLQEFDGYVFFDLMLSHGLRILNNQVELKFKNGSFVKESFRVWKPQRELESKKKLTNLLLIIDAAVDFFTENQDLLNCGVLDDNEIKEAKHFLELD